MSANEVYSGLFLQKRVKIKFVLKSLFTGESGVQYKTAVTFTLLQDLPPPGMSFRHHPDTCPVLSAEGDTEMTGGADAADKRYFVIKFR